jgi:hypothetical protein
MRQIKASGNRNHAQNASWDIARLFSNETHLSPFLILRL